MARTKQTARKSANSRAPRNWWRWLRKRLVLQRRWWPWPKMSNLDQKWFQKSKELKVCSKPFALMLTRSFHLARTELNSRDRSDFTSKVGSSNVGFSSAGRLAEVSSAWYWILQMPRRIWIDEQYLFDNMPATEVPELSRQSTASSR